MFSYVSSWLLFKLKFLGKFLAYQKLCQLLHWFQLHDFFQYVLPSRAMYAASVGLFLEISEIFHFWKCSMIVYECFIHKLLTLQ